jgi:hypothetical protein
VDIGPYFLQPHSRIHANESTDAGHRNNSSVTQLEESGYSVNAHADDSETSSTAMQLHAKKESWGPNTKQKHTCTHKPTMVYKSYQSGVPEVCHFASIIIIHTMNHTF